MIFYPRYMGGVLILASLNNAIYTPVVIIHGWCVQPRLTLDHTVGIFLYSQSRFYCVGAGLEVHGVELWLAKKAVERSGERLAKRGR